MFSLPECVQIVFVFVRIVSYLGFLSSVCVFELGFSLPEYMQIVCVCVRILSYLGYPFSVCVFDHGSSRVCADSVCEDFVPQMQGYPFSVCVYEHGFPLPECVEIVCV